MAARLRAGTIPELMRPLTLQISGLNSFRKSVAIDFDKLLKDGLFGIFGPTGSGKSTILDAITLALYGKVRRAPSGTQGIINMGEQRCSVSFSFAIGENGSRRHCTVERLLARNKANGVETKKARLAVYRDGVLEKVGEKSNELKDMVNDIVGINVDDFLRAVVLPQGAFADFLTLEAKERSAVLQRLFGLYQLGDQLNHVLKQYAQDLQEAHAQIQGRLQDLRLYDDDALALCTEAVREAEQRQGEVREALRAIEERYTEAAALYAQIVEYRSLMQSEESRRMEQGKLQALRTRIELAERSMMVNPALSAVVASQARYAEADGRYREAVRENDAVQIRLAETRARFTRAEASYRERFDRLCEELNELRLVKEGRDDLRGKQERLGAVSDLLRGILDTFEERSRSREEASAAIVKLEEEIAAIDRRIEECTISADERQLLNRMQLSIQTQKNLQRELDHAERDSRSIASDADTAADALRVALADERAKEQEATAARNELTTLKERLASQTAERDELRTLHARLKEGLGEVDLHEKNIAAYEAELREQRTKLAGSRKMLDEGTLHCREAQSHESVARQERDAIVRLRDEAHRRLALASLAEHLQDGVPCPLCGALEHLAPFHSHGSAAGELEAVDKELARIEKKLHETEERRRQIEHSLTRSETALEHLEQDVEEREKKLASTRIAVQDVLKGIDAEHPIANLEGLRARIEGVTTRGLALKKSIEEVIAAVDANEARVAAADAGRASAAEQRARLEAELNARRSRHAELDRSLSDLRTRLADERRAFAEQSNGHTPEAAEAALQRMQESDRRIEELRDGAQHLRTSLQAARTTRDGHDRDLQQIGRQRDEMEGERRTLEADIAYITERLKQRLSELVPEVERDEMVERLIGRREEARDRVKREYDEAKAGYDAANTGAHVAQERINTCWNVLCREERERDEADRACRNLLVQQGFDSIAEAEAGMLPPDELRMRREEARAIEENLERTRLRLVELREKIAGREIGASEMSALEADVAIARGTAEEAIRGLGAAQEKLRECREKNVEWKNVSQQDAFSAEGKATADQLAKYLRGNGFIDFLANERLSEICRRASMQLDVLTAGRFELDARLKEGFIIRDNGNGGGERSPSSLSGGETFLVSLSLAIALSDTIQLGHSPLEFFFLDEGFGTLDSDLLETVMNTLDRLRSRHRAIGVISHVAQLRERISRRLIVTPASAVEGSTVRYEAA
jgi:DNA repair protein SbcC/Rad50